MALNLIRNSKVYLTTNVDATTGKVNEGALTTNSTYEIQVLDGFAFSQNTNAEVVTINEAGVAPVRGQRSFNTSLAPVDFSFSTYIRPYNSGTAITAEESSLWNALFTDKAVGAATNVITTTGVSSVTYAFASGVGTITITGTGMTFVTLSVGDIVVVGGIATTTPANNQNALNVAAKILTLTATSITLQVIQPITTAITATTLATASTIKFYKSAWAPVLAGNSYVSSGASDKNQLLKFGIIVIVDQATYVIDNCAMSQAVIDFGLDAIATAAWTGQATVLRQLATTGTAAAGTFGGGLTGTYTPKQTAAGYITNKLSTATLSLVNQLVDSAGSTVAAAGTAYTVALTGGSITINNNISYITPANLGVVNVPATYYTGTRSITGTINAYLRTGTAGDTGSLLSNMLSAASGTIEPMFALGIQIGGSSNALKVTLDMPAATMTIPSVDAQQVLSTAINFTAQGMVPSSTANANTFDLSVPSDIAIRYYAP